MLAVVTEDAISLVLPATLKGTTTVVEPFCSQLPGTPSVGAWLSNNTSLVFAHEDSVDAFSPSSGTSHPIYTTPPGSAAITCLAARDARDTLVLSTGSSLHIVENVSANAPTPSHTLDTHKSPILALAFAHDGSLLASAAADAVHVHNLALASPGTPPAHTALRGLPLSPGSAVTASAFSPHMRTRLLLGIGAQLIVYDTTRPSAPAKVIGTGGAAVSFIACSPFSKTLVAIASTAGVVCLVDLEKEKGLVRTLDLARTITALVFSPEGGALYLGTADGMVLVQNLRELDKPPRAITVSASGKPVVALCLQKKPDAKAAIASVRKGSTTTAAPRNTPAKPARASLRSAVNPAGSISSPVAGRRVSAAVSSPSVRPLSRKVSTAPTLANTRASAASLSTPQAARTKKALAVGLGLPGTPLPALKVLTPTRDPLKNGTGVGRRDEDDDLSVQMDTLAPLATKVSKPRSAPSTGRSPLTSPATRKPAPSAVRVSAATSTGRARRPAQENGAADPARVRARTTSTAPSAVSVSASAAARAARTNPKWTESTGAGAGAKAKEARARIPSSGSGSSLAASRSGSTLSASASASRPGSSSPRPPVPPLPAAHAHAHTRPRARSSARTPSPDLPAPDSEDEDGPATPLRALGAGGAGLHSPAVDRRVDAGKSRKVGFAGSAESDDGSEVEEVSTPAALDLGDHDDDVEAHLSVQVSPVRRPAGSVPTSTWVPSPLRPSLAPGSSGPSPGSGSGSGSGAHDILRGLVQDAMFPFQMETKDALTGLRLDLVRLGRGWRKELREAVDGFAGEVGALRAENARLREENERLRRGY